MRGDIERGSPFIHSSELHELTVLIYRLKKYVLEVSDRYLNVNRANESQLHITTNERSLDVH